MSINKGDSLKQLDSFIIANLACNPKIGLSDLVRPKMNTPSYVVFAEPSERSIRRALYKDKNNLLDIGFVTRIADPIKNNKYLYKLTEKGCIYAIFSTNIKRYIERNGNQDNYTNYLNLVLDSYKDYELIDTLRLIKEWNGYIFNIIHRVISNYFDNLKIKGKGRDYRILFQRCAPVDLLSTIYNCIRSSYIEEYERDKYAFICELKKLLDEEITWFLNNLDLGNYLEELRSDISLNLDQQSYVRAFIIHIITYTIVFGIILSIKNESEILRYLLNIKEPEIAVKTSVDLANNSIKFVWHTKSESNISKYNFNIRMRTNKEITLNEAINNIKRAKKIAGMLPLPSEDLHKWHDYIIIILDKISEDLSSD